MISLISSTRADADEDSLLPLGQTIELPVTIVGRNGLKHSPRGSVLPSSQSTDGADKVKTFVEGANAPS